jgi:hypothetical protein
VNNFINARLQAHDESVVLLARSFDGGSDGLGACEPVDFFHLAMPQVTDEADGGPDALLVRVAAGHVGWGRIRGGATAVDCGILLSRVAMALFQAPCAKGLDRDCQIGLPSRPAREIMRMREIG